MIDVWGMSMVCDLILILWQHPNDISSSKAPNTSQLKSHLLIDLLILPSSLRSFDSERRPRKQKWPLPWQALWVLLIYWLVLWLWLLLFVLLLLLPVHHCTHSCCTLLVHHISHHLSYHLLEWLVHPSVLKTSVPSIKWILACIRGCSKKGYKTSHHLQYAMVSELKEARFRIGEIASLKDTFAHWSIPLD